jgi:Immunoglobulin I-set domain
MSYTKLLNSCEKTILCCRSFSYQFYRFLKSRSCPYRCRFCQGITIVEEPDGSLLTVQNLQPDDEGLIECVAVNSVGKAVAASRLTVICPPRFLQTTTDYSFLKEELVRLKFDFEASPAPHGLCLTKEGVGRVGCGVGDGIEVTCRDSVVVVRVDNVAERHAGKYVMELENDYGTASLEFRIQVRMDND